MVPSTAMTVSVLRLWLVCEGKLVPVLLLE
jgi:hypothetical protein